MPLYTTIHLHNVASNGNEQYKRWFDGPHRRALATLRGYKSADRYEVTAEQIMADIPQPWRFLSIYDFEIRNAEIDIPALGPLIAEARDAGLIANDKAERLYTYKLFADWKGSENWQRAKPLSGVSIILGNYVPGRWEEYQSWYENVHSLEVINVPGFVAMKRGELAAIQIAPRHYCPGDQLILCAQQTDDLRFSIDEFVARAVGKSSSGIAMQSRSAAASFARTIHYFRKASGDGFWKDGVAYAGDRSVYQWIPSRS